MGRPNYGAFHGSRGHDQANRLVRSSQSLCRRCEASAGKRVSGQWPIECPACRENESADPMRSGRRSRSGITPQGRGAIECIIYLHSARKYEIAPGPAGFRRSNAGIHRPEGCGLALTSRTEPTIRHQSPCMGKYVQSRRLTHDTGSSGICVQTSGPSAWLLPEPVFAVAEYWLRTKGAENGRGSGKLGWQTGAGGL